MWGWGFLLLWLVSSLSFLSIWLQNSKPSWPELCVACAAAAGTGVILFGTLPQWFIPAGLAAGHALYWLESLFRRKPGTLAGACAGAGAAAICLPLSMGGEDAWRYGFLTAGVLSCLFLVLRSRKSRADHTHLTDPYPSEPRHLHGWVFLPLAVLPVSLILLPFSNVFGMYSALALSGVLLCIYVLLLALQRLIYERQTALRLIDALSRWQRESRDYMNTIRSQRHDFNLHVHAISGLIGSGEYEECREYVQKLVAEAAAVNDIMPVSDAVVGSMLYNMREDARRKGSDILYHITYDMADILCNGFECNKIIGNLLQNAIDALQTPEDKAYGIHLRIFKRRGNTVVTVENRFTGDREQIVRVFEPGYSTKKNHEGIGLSMVLRTVEQYGGRVYPEFSENAIRFVVNIPNKVNLAGGEEAQ